MNHSNDHIHPSNKVRVLLCFSGSVATVKVPELALSLLNLKYFELILIGTGNPAHHFLNRSKYYNPTYWNEFISRNCEDLILYDSEEWDYWQRLGDPVLHIELRKWADILLLAPASADVIAKASIGVSDTLLLSVLRAWDYSKPCILCPAMNTLMWEHPATMPALEKLMSWGWKVVSPTIKTLACAETGNGALAAVHDITETVRIEAMNILSQGRIAQENKILLVLLQRKKLERLRSSNDSCLSRKCWLINIMIPAIMVALSMKNSNATQ